MKAKECAPRADSWGTEYRLQGMWPANVTVPHPLGVSGLLRLCICRPRRRCKSTLKPGGLANEVAADDDEGESRVGCATAPLPRFWQHGDGIAIWLMKSAKLHVCGNNPDCNGFEIEEGQFKIKGYGRAPIH